MGNTRPITDRVKEAIFDALGSRFDTPGELPEILVADVFCGGGSLGLEALSRGAARACFFDRDPEAVRVLKQNLNKLAAGSDAKVMAVDVWRASVRPPASFAPLDLVFLDPPFMEARNMSNGSKIGTLLRRLGTSEVTTDSTLIVFRHETKVMVPEIVGKHWRVCQRREYGINAISLLVPCTGSAQPDPAHPAHPAHIPTTGEEDDDELAPGS